MEKMKWRGALENFGREGWGRNAVKFMTDCLWSDLLSIQEYTVYIYFLLLGSGEKIQYFIWYSRAINLILSFLSISIGRLLF